MRVRSYDVAGSATEEAIAQPGHRLKRGRSSSVQNHVVGIAFKGFHTDWYCEMRALRSKDTDTVAVSILEVVQEIAALIRTVFHGPSQRRVRVLHLSTGDAIATNDAAMRRAHAKMRDSVGSERWHTLFWVCSSHQVLKRNTIAIFELIPKKLTLPPTNKKP